MTKFLGGVLGAVSFTALCSLAACTVSSTTDVSGTDGGSGSDGGTSDGSTTGDGSTTTDGGDGGGTCTMKVDISDNVACNTCAKTNCCETVNACADNAECVALDTCAGACLDVDAGPDGGGAIEDCIAACETAHPNGKTDWDGINNCIETSCSSTCQ